MIINRADYVKVVGSEFIKSSDGSGIFSALTRHIKGDTLPDGQVGADSGGEKVISARIATWRVSPIFA